MISKDIEELIQNDRILSGMLYRHRFSYLPKPVLVDTDIEYLGSVYVFGFDTKDMHSMDCAFLLAQSPKHSDGWTYICGNNVTEVIGCDE